MRKAAQIVARILAHVADLVAPGVTTAQLDRLAEEMAISMNAKPAFKGYHGYPASLCSSVNEEVVHGIPGSRILKQGDIVGLDFGVILDGYYGDAALTVPVGPVTSEVEKLLRVTRESLHLGIAQARPDNRVSDISRAVQQHVEANGFSVVRDFVGHGIGQAMHEEPQIPNYVSMLSNFDPRLKAGMTLAIEPMVNLGGYEVIVDPHDQWTVRTRDKRYSAHYEHTVLITEGEPEILSVLPIGEDGVWQW